MNNFEGIVMTGTNISIPGLEKLHEIVLPPAVSWMPQTAGWYALFGLIGLVAVWLIFMRVRNIRANRYRRLALKRLDGIAGKVTVPESRESVLTELSSLVKWTALRAYPRTRVAGLSGSQWLFFLDRSLGGNDFTQGEGRVLAELAYVPASRISSLSDATISRLIDLVRRWITEHVPAVLLPDKDMDHASI